MNPLYIILITILLITATICGWFKQFDHAAYLMSIACFLKLSMEK